MSPATETSMGSGNIGSRHFHNRRPILGNADGFTHICGVTCTELVLDVGAALASA